MQTMRTACTLILWALSLICGLAACGASGPYAERLFENGQFYTVDPGQPWAEAVAVTGGEIIFVGSTADAQAFIGPGTQRFDLEGRTVLPGFHDSHVHLIEAFHQASGTCLLASGVDPELWIDELQACAGDQVGTEWVMGVGHSIHDLLEHIEWGGRPPVQILDDAVWDRPMVIMEETSPFRVGQQRGLASGGFRRVHARSTRWQDPQGCHGGAQRHLARRCR